MPDEQETTADGEIVIEQETDVIIQQENEGGFEIEAPQEENAGETEERIVSIHLNGPNIVVNRNFETIDLSETITFEAHGASFNVMFSPLEDDSAFLVEEGQPKVLNFNPNARYGYCSFMVTQMTEEGDVDGAPAGDPPSVNSDLDIQPRV